MQFYQHRFSKIEDYLHHRPPYLLVDRVSNLQKHAIQTSKQLQMEDPWVAGHFPGAPVFPGALMQELVTQSAGILIAANYNPMKTYDTHDPNANQYALGVLLKVDHSRYRSFARPGDTLDVSVELLDMVYPAFRFSGAISVDSQEIMSIQFLLANIATPQLTGSASG